MANRSSKKYGSRREGIRTPLPSMPEKTNKALLQFESSTVTILNIALLWSEVKEVFR